MRTDIVLFTALVAFRWACTAAAGEPVVATVPPSLSDESLKADQACNDTLQARYTALFNPIFGPRPKTPPVLLNFTVEADGTVKDVMIVQSSGEGSLDNLAVDCTTQRHYTPAMRNGQPVKVRWHMKYMFAISS